MILIRLSVVWVDINNQNNSSLIETKVNNWRPISLLYMQYNTPLLFMILGATCGELV